MDVDQNHIKDESEGARELLREKKSIGRPLAFLLVFLSFLTNLALDIIRISYLFFLKTSNSNHTLLFASNKNQYINVSKYSANLYQRLSIVDIKSFRSLTSIPQTPLSLNAIYQLLTNSKYRIHDYSNLDIQEAAYQDSFKYLAFIIKLLGCRLAILSREDSQPFIEIGKAVQSLDIKLLVIEHGILTRYYTSFDTSQNTMHVFSSEENLSKRTPKPKNIIHFHSPLYDLMDLLVDFKARVELREKNILIADTYNLRPYLNELASLLSKIGSVELRYHPGFNAKLDNYLISEDKIESLARSEVVVTGISGFSLESAFCGIPTIILYEENDEWGFPTLELYKDLPHVKIAKINDFIKH